MSSSLRRGNFATLLIKPSWAHPHLPFSVITLRINPLLIICCCYIPLSRVDVTLEGAIVRIVAGVYREVHQLNILKIANQLPCSTQTSHQILHLRCAAVFTAWAFERIPLNKPGVPRLSWLSGIAPGTFAAIKSRRLRPSGHGRAGYSFFRTARLPATAFLKSKPILSNG